MATSFTVMSKAIDDDENHETLSREHPISEFLRSQREHLSDLSHDEFVEKFEAHMNLASGKSEEKHNHNELEGKDISAKESNMDRPFGRKSSGVINLTKIVLKFTTVSEGANDAPSFTVDTKGARIGRDACNEVFVPSDVRLAPVAHATVEYSKGSFYIVDGGHNEFAASIRIGVGIGLKKTMVSRRKRSLYCRQFSVSM